MMEQTPITRRDFVRNSLIASAAFPLLYHAWPDGKWIHFHLDNTDDASEVRSFMAGYGADVQADHLVLPPIKKLIAHPNLPVLFALLRLDAWQFRPRGAVCSVSYCHRTGTFLRRVTRPLSLGATGVLDAAFLNDARQVVIMTSAGIQNVFQLNVDGELGELIHVNKTIPVASEEEGLVGDRCPRGIAIDLEHNGERRWYSLGGGNPTVLLSQRSNEIL